MTDPLPSPPRSRAEFEARVNAFLDEYVQLIRKHQLEVYGTYPQSLLDVSNRPDKEKYLRDLQRTIWKETLGIV
jgi:hypothetical protein